MSDEAITPPHGGQGMNLAATARRLVSEARRGILCTLIPSDGYPYGSIDFPNFQFYRLHVERVRLIAGFGQMGWISGTAYRKTT